MIKNGQYKWVRTPLNGFEHSRLERLGKARVQRSCFLTLTLHSLEVVEPTLARDFALKLFQAVERHARSISSERSGH